MTGVEGWVEGGVLLLGDIIRREEEEEEVGDLLFWGGELIVYCALVLE